MDSRIRGNDGIGEGSIRPASNRNHMLCTPSMGTIACMPGPDSPTDLLRLIENLVRAGTVLAVDHKAARCRVSTGELETHWLPWFARRAGDVRHWSPPFVGEQCMVLSPGGDMTAGLVLVGLFSDSIPANGDNGNVERTTYPDGAVIEYDHAAHALKIELPGGGTANVIAPDSITVQCKTADVTASDSATVHSQQITLDAPDTLATGKLTVQGLLTWQGGMVGSGTGPSGAGAEIGCTIQMVNGADVVAGDISLKNHRTSGIQPGGGTSGVPVA
jgi:phage baseplate assembly protein V